MRRIVVAGVAGFTVLIASPAVAGGTADSTVAMTREGLLHDWRATLRYGGISAPLEDDLGIRVGDGERNRIMMGLDVGVGTRGFAGIRVGGGWREGMRAFEFDDMAGSANSMFVGVTGGAFLLPYLAVGLSMGYGHEDGTDDFTNRFSHVTTRVDHETDSWHAAPFILLTAPVGVGDLSLLAAYLHQRSSADYSVPSFPWLDSTDSGRLDSLVAELSFGQWVSPRLRFGASIGWTAVLSQRTLGAELPLDDNWGTLGLNATWRLTDAMDITIDASHDVADDRGNGFSWGVALAYRF